MRLHSCKMKQLAITCVLLLCIAESLSPQTSSRAVADCSGRTAALGRSQGLQSPTTSQNDTQEVIGGNRTVSLLANFSNSGKIRHVKVETGPLNLRPAAINAVKERSYIVKRKSAELRRIHLAVIFDDKESVSAVGQLWVGPNGPAFANVPPALLAGAPGCVHSPPMARVSPSLMQTRLVRQVDPVYPPKAKAKHIAGTVTLHVYIDEEGNVFDTRKVSGSNFLVAAAVDAVMQWKYQPFSLNGTPVKVVTLVDVNFQSSER